MTADQSIAKTQWAEAIKRLLDVHASLEHAGYNATEKWNAARGALFAADLHVMEMLSK